MGSEFLEDDDMLLYACKYGLPLNTNAYTPYELMKLKEAGLKYQHEKIMAERQRISQVLGV